MDAEMVRDVEFSRSLRGYNISEVDLFLEKMESAFARRDLETETLQNKIRDLTENKENQAEKIRELAGNLNSVEQEKKELLQKLEDVQKALEQREAEAAALRSSLEEANSRLEAAEKNAAALKKEKPAVHASHPAKQSVKSAPEEKNSRDSIQKKILEAGTSAKGSLKQLAKNLKERPRK